MDWRIKLFPTLCILAFSSVADGQGLPRGMAEELGFSLARLERLDRHFEEQIAKRTLPGGVALIARRGKIAYFNHFGMADLEQQTPMAPDAIFRLASMTKPIVAVAVMMLYEEGHFLLHDPVATFIPEFDNIEVLLDVNPQDSTYRAEPAIRPVTIHHLLTHTSGLGYSFTNKRLRPIYHKADIPDVFETRNTTIGEKMRALATLPLARQPGEKYVYGLNSDVLGYLIEVVSGLPLDQFLKNRLFAPLRMEDTYFFLPTAKSGRLVTVYTNDEEGLKRHPSADYPIEGAKTYFSGGAGLSGTAADYARFCQMMLNGGTLDGVRILSPKTVELMTVDHVKDDDVQYGLGFGVRGDSSELFGAKGSYEWGGHWGTSFWIDPQEEIIGILMTQVLTSYNVERFRPLVYQAVVE